MRAALVVNPVARDWKANLEKAAAMIHEAAAGGANMVLLGEMAVTGMVNNDNPAHDLPIGQSIPGPITRRFARTAASLGIWLGFGILEREGTRLYDTALLVSPDGGIRLKYRRIQPQWHAKSADPAVYCQGEEFPKAQTAFGSVVFMVCGDLYDDGLKSEVRRMRPDWVLHLFARSFPDGSRDQAKWNREELPEHQRLVAGMGVPVLATSYLCVEPFSPEADTFGGAMVFGRDGGIKADLPLDQVGILEYDLRRLKGCSRPCAPPQKP